MNRAAPKLSPARRIAAEHVAYCPDILGEITFADYANGLIARDRLPILVGLSPAWRPNLGSPNRSLNRYDASRPQRGFRHSGSVGAERSRNPAVG